MKEKLDQKKFDGKPKKEIRWKSRQIRRITKEKIDKHLFFYNILMMARQKCIQNSI